MLSFINMLQQAADKFYILKSMVIDALILVVVASFSSLFITWFIYMEYNYGGDYNEEISEIERDNK